MLSFAVRNAHIQQHTGALSSWALVHSQHETSLDLSLQSLLHTKRRTRPYHCCANNEAACYMLALSGFP